VSERIDEMERGDFRVEKISQADLDGKNNY